MIDGLKRAPLWWTLAIEDIRSRYARSFLGISWVFLAFAGFVFVKILVFTPLSQEGGRYFAAYVAVGFFIWNYIVSCLVEGSTTFVQARNWIQGASVPLSVFVYKVIARNLILNAVNLLVVVLVFAVARPEVTWLALWSIPFAFLVVFNMIWVTFLFAVIGARFRDFEHLISTLVRIMLFLTPIFWTPEDIGPLWDYLVFNPFSHFLILVRAPLIDGVIPLQSLYVVCSLAAVGWICAVLTYHYGHKRVVFWL